MFDYDIEAAEAVKVLDEYDFTADVSMCLANGVTGSYSVRTYLEHKYGERVEKAFGCLTPDEFMTYMTVRCNVLWDERISYHMWRPRNPKTAGFFK